MKLIISKTLQLIEEQIGLKLTPCGHFSGIRKHQQKEYFNVELPQRISESEDYLMLEKFANKSKLITIEPNGLNRVAIYFKN
jgi:hypothetical protein